MQPKKWIVAGMAAMFMTTAGAAAVNAASAQQGQVVITSPKLAQMDSVKAMYKKLLDEGYHYIKVSRSMLGRAVFEAWNGTQKREVVLNLTSGEVMHDMTEAHAGYPEGAMAGEGMDKAHDTMEGAMQDAGNMGQDMMDDAGSTAGDMMDDAGSGMGEMGDHVTGGGMMGSGN